MYHAFHTHFESNTKDRKLVLWKFENFESDSYTDIYGPVSSNYLVYWIDMKIL